MRVGICVIDVDGGGRFVGLVRQDAGPNEGDLRTRVAKHLGTITQKVHIRPLYVWDLSEGGGMCGLTKMEELERYIIGPFLQQLSVTVTRNPIEVTLTLPNGELVAMAKDPEEETP